jgi:hypothetical protein
VPASMRPYLYPESGNHWPPLDYEGVAGGFL